MLDSDGQLALVVSDLPPPPLPGPYLASVLPGSAADPACAAATAGPSAPSLVLTVVPAPLAVRSVAPSGAAAVSAAMIVEVEVSGFPLLASSDPDSALNLNLLQVCPTETKFILIAHAAVFLGSVHWMSAPQIIHSPPHPFFSPCAHATDFWFC